MTNIEDILQSVADRIGLFNYPLYANKFEFNELVDRIPNEQKYVFVVDAPIQTTIKMGKDNKNMIVEEYIIKLKFLRFHKHFGEYTNELTEEIQKLRALRSVYLVALSRREEIRSNSPQNSDTLLTSQETFITHYTDANLFGLETTIKVSLVVPYDVCLAYSPCTSSESIC